MKKQQRDGRVHLLPIEGRSRLLHPRALDALVLLAIRGEAPLSAADRDKEGHVAGPDTRRAS